MYKVFIQPGWAEDNWQIKRFSRHFPATWKLTRTSNEADIILAHSAGCFDIPDIDLNGKLIFLIGVPYWPHRSILIGVLQNIFTQAPSQIRQWGIKFWAEKILWNVIYIITHPLYAAQNRKRLRRNIFEDLKGQKVVIIRNQSDPYCSPEIKSIAARSKFRYKELPGAHEDCWYNPKPYIDLLLKELK